MLGVLRGPRHVGVVGALLQARLDLRHGTIVEGADEILARCAVAARCWSVFLLVILAFLPRAHGAIQPAPLCPRTLARVERRGRGLDRACRKAAVAGDARDRSIVDVLDPPRIQF